jgi:hypothetical protein
MAGFLPGLKHAAFYEDIPLGHPTSPPGLRNLQLSMGEQACKMRCRPTYSIPGNHPRGFLLNFMPACPHRNIALTGYLVIRMRRSIGPNLTETREDSVYER